ncbi:MAG: 30S ribosomal protein S2 [Candidatus Schekmanbacteria bacterium]|nr:MAG: 30S ribosomal protein S2 [Candidatus Schekmanbacteria bacterium]
MSTISMKALLENGVHFGHQTKRWNPKMKKYIFGAKHNIYIIDLQKTLKLFKEAAQFVKDTSANGGKILFVGTKKQAAQIIKEEAERCESPYVSERWLGGTLTNFVTISKSVKKLKEIEEMKAAGIYDAMTKKEAIKLEKERIKLERYFGGIKTLDRLPDAVFVIDPKKERICINEANILDIPVVGLVDTNCDPELIDYVIPGNDDAIRSIKVITSAIADAVLEGKEIWKEKELVVKKGEEEAEAENAAEATDRQLEVPQEEENDFFDEEGLN